MLKDLARRFHGNVIYKKGSTGITTPRTESHSDVGERLLNKGCPIFRKLSRRDNAHAASGVAIWDPGEQTWPNRVPRLWSQLLC